eukprot:Cvel_3381.t1-p1 / transcript=Cvel_3381.t1 / gene=Cvel_3381 / organism=Chromera_velia_CCMP2878 / gene_product=hypothetical protein / transcript_product=hypothetical protein / location=Cvel_scaffold136:26234-26947(+) / protein_length=238 / sequence_SO=supercontig / SO=protein_coding / is_pseudo=false
MGMSNHPQRVRTAGEREGGRRTLQKETVEERERGKGQGVVEGPGGIFFMRGRSMSVSFPPPSPPGPVGEGGGLDFRGGRGLREETGNDFVSVSSSLHHHQGRQAGGGRDRERDREGHVHRTGRRAKKEREPKADQGRERDRGSEGESKCMPTLSPPPPPPPSLPTRSSSTGVVPSFCPSASASVEGEKEKRKTEREKEKEPEKDGFSLMDGKLFGVFQAWREGGEERGDEGRGVFSLF